MIGLVAGFVLLPAMLIAAVLSLMNSLESRVEPLRRWWWLWVIAGAAYGLALRLHFGITPSSLSPGPMSMTFLVLTPFIVGAITVYGLHHQRPPVAQMILAPWATITLMVIGCVVTLLEGSICVAIMMPLLMFCASVGGVLMGLLMRRVGRRSELTAIALLPLIFAPLETALPQPEHVLEIADSIVVQAAPETIWREIMTAREISRDELPMGLNRLIGVPAPVEGINVATPTGEVRHSTWERGIRFRALVVERKPYESITWRYEFAPDSFPAGSMDEHVAVGGRYFDLLDTTFRLVPLSAGTTRLEIVAHYRVQSAVNAYAIPVSRVLGHDFLRTLLTLYRQRSEKHV